MDQRSANTFLLENLIAHVMGRLSPDKNRRLREVDRKWIDAAYHIVGAKTSSDKAFVRHVIKDRINAGETPHVLAVEISNEYGHYMNE